MPMNDSDKLTHFADEAYVKAKEIADKINAENDAREQAAIENGTRKIKAEALAYYEREMKAFKRENAKKLSVTVMKTRKELLLYREEIMKKVFDKARESILEFAETAEYKNYLVKLCVNALKDHRGSYTIYLSERDLAYKYDILEGLDRLIEDKFDDESFDSAPVYSIMPDKNIKLGGARFLSASGSIIINATFDDELLQNREYFAELLGPVAEIKEDNSDE